MLKRWETSQSGIWPADTPIVVVGSGGLAREFLGICLDLGEEDRVLGFLDDNPTKHGGQEDGYRILGSPDWLVNQAPSGTRYVNGIGSTSARLHLDERLNLLGVQPATLVSPHAVVSPFASLGEGTVVCAGSIINTNVTIGRHCIINLCCTVGHDSALGDFVTVNPGTNISGNVRIGEGTDVGTGSAINQQIAVGCWAILGSGSVAVRDIPDNVTAVGTPAKMIKEREPGWQLLEQD